MAGENTSHPELPNFVPASLVAAFPVLEILLGGWLLSGVCRFGAWLVALTTFFTFSMVAFSQVRAGVSECGCLGSTVSVPPWVMLTLDLTILFVLVLFRTRWTGWPDVGPGLSLAVRTLVVCGVLLTVGAGYSYWRYGSVTAGVAAFAGMPVTVTTPVVDVGRVPVGEITTGTVEVISLTGSEEQVAYISMKCRCAEFDLPITLPPDRATRIGFRLRAPNEPGAFRRPAVVKSSAGEARFEMVGVAVASQ